MIIILFSGFSGFISICILVHDVCLSAPNEKSQVTIGCHFEKQVVPIRDPVILSKIHQTYRIGYIKVEIVSQLSKFCDFHLCNV